MIVLDPLLDNWCADLVTDNTSKFLKTVQNSRNCKLFLDESGETVGRYNEEMFWLATRARHMGHQSHFLAQRVVQLNKTVRDQTVHLFTFRISTVDAKSLAIDWSNEQLMLASQLGKFEFLHTSRFGRTEKFTVTLNGASRNYGSITNSSRNNSLLGDN